MLDHTKASVEGDSYTAKTGETVKVWNLKGLTGWKSVSVRQGDEVEACKVLDQWRAELGRVAAIRVQLDEAAVNVSCAKQNRAAFMPIFQKYPQKLADEKIEMDKAVAEAEAALAKLLKG